MLTKHGNDVILSDIILISIMAIAFTASTVLCDERYQIGFIILSAITWFLFVVKMCDKIQSVK